MNLYQQHLIALAACSMLLACSGGDSESTADATSGTASAPSATDPAAPAPAACTAAPIGATGYSLVFKGCDAANVATYYDKSECVRDNATGLIWQGQTPAGSANVVFPRQTGRKPARLGGKMPLHCAYI